MISHTLQNVLMGATAVLAIIAGIFAVILIEAFFKKKIEERTTYLREVGEQQKQFMIEISHGLQTPLTILKSEVESLKERLPLEKLGKLEKSVDQISNFIYDFLNLAQLETLQKEFDKKSVNLSLLLSNLTEYFGVLAEERGILVETTIEPNVVISGQKDKLEELMTNLLSNAVRYMRERGEKKIFISLSKGTDAVELLIKDTGIGIGPEDLPYIFDKFYRVKNPRIKGIGLGLAICKKIVEKHNGSIEISSELGKGTAFIIRF